MVMKHLTGDYCLSNFFNQVIAAFFKSLWYPPLFYMFKHRLVKEQLMKAKPTLAYSLF